MQVQFPGTVDQIENNTNKTMEIDENSTDVQYPSAKAVYNAVSALKTDFIVEQGKSGIWTYRKWNSGIAECWGNYDCSSVDGTYEQWSSTNSYLWVVKEAVPIQSYPFTFTEFPCLTATLNRTGSGYNHWLMPQNTGSAAQTPSYTLVRGSAGDGSYTCVCSFYAIGTWK